MLRSLASPPVQTPGCLWQAGASKGSALCASLTNTDYNLSHLDLSALQQAEPPDLLFGFSVTWPTPKVSRVCTWSSYRASDVFRTTGTETWKERPTGVTFDVWETVSGLRELGRRTEGKRKSESQRKSEETERAARCSKRTGESIWCKKTNCATSNQRGKPRVEQRCEKEVLSETTWDLFQELTVGCVSWK